MSDLTIHAAAGAVGLASGALGVLGTLYARARADGRRDHVLEDLERRSILSAKRIDRLEADGHETAKTVARLESKLDGVAETTKDTREMIRALVNPRR